MQSGGAGAQSVMRQREVRRTAGVDSAPALVLPELSFGAASLGNLYAPVPDEIASATLRDAIAGGLTYVDTAPHYGHGLSERRVGDVLRGRDDVVLSTKVGRLLRADPALSGNAERQGFASPLPFDRVFDYSYEGVMRSFEDSQHRLGLARIDILYVHDIGALTHGDRHPALFAQLTRGGGFRALEDLRAGGAIRAFGVGANEWQVCEEAMDHADLDLVLLAGRYTLLEQTALDSFLPRCLSTGVSVVIGGVYNSGILATGTNGSGTLFHDYAPPAPDILARVQRIEAVCDAHQVPLPAAALAFALAHPAVASVLVGLANPAQVADTLALYGHDIPAALWDDLRTQQLIHPDAPLPQRIAA